jgi:hypothetical protein
MDFRKRLVVEPGAKARLDKIDPGFKGKHESHKEALPDAGIANQVARMDLLQYLLYADGDQPLLEVMEALPAVALVPFARRSTTLIALCRAPSRARGAKGRMSSCAAMLRRGLGWRCRQPPEWRGCRGPSLSSAHARAGGCASVRRTGTLDRSGCSGREMPTTGQDGRVRAHPAVCPAKDQVWPGNATHRSLFQPT